MGRRSGRRALPSTPRAVPSLRAAMTRGAGWRRHRPAESLAHDEACQHGQASNQRSHFRQGRRGCDAIRRRALSEYRAGDWHAAWISPHLTMHTKPSGSRTVVPAEVLAAKREQRKAENRQGKVDPVARVLAGAAELYASRATRDDGLLSVMPKGLDLLAEMRRA
jgi:hypothetical protein